MIFPKIWFTHLYKQYLTHQNADLPLEDYLKKYQSLFKKVRIGCSFAPDLVEQMYRLENNNTNISVDQKLKILKILIHELSITDIRLGIKWNKVIDDSGSFDFSYYKPFLDYCISQKVKVTLNIGPIKTFGWPEEHIPKRVLDHTNVQFGQKVTARSEIGVEALKYLETLLRFIQTQYTPAQLRYISAFQPENEAFNIYGKLKLSITENYLLEVIKQINIKFPEHKILLSTAETRNTKQIESIIKKSISKLNMRADQFVSGINYYYNLPHYFHLPKIGPIDSITVSNTIQHKTIESHIRSSRKLGFKIEVSEAQFEQWGKVYLSPGNSSHEAKYLFARCVENILDPQLGGVIRLWGFERYAKKLLEGTLTKDHQENIELINAINSNSAK